MLRPTPGELIGGISRSLREAVLPELPAGAAARQLKAALHALDRLQRCWDLLPDAIAEDNADVGTTIAAIMDAGPSASPALIAAMEAADQPKRETAADEALAWGVHARPLAALLASNRRLQQRLIVLDAWLRAADEQDPDTYGPLCREIDSLHRRMVDRELAAWGTTGTLEEAVSKVDGERPREERLGAEA